jgi:hypothetical protein
MSCRYTLLRNVNVHKFRIQTIVIAARANDYEVGVPYTPCILAHAVRPCNVTRSDRGNTEIGGVRWAAAFETKALLSCITKEYWDLATNQS